MPVGDSITHGYQGGSINVDGNGYRRQLWWNIKDNIKHFVGSQMSGNLPDPYSEGYDGAIIADIATFINGSLSSMRPNVVLIHAGTNDMNRPIDPDNAPERLGAMIDEVVSICPDAAVLVAEIITTNNTAAAELGQTYNAAIPGVVSSRADDGKKVLLVDMSSLLTTDELTDGIHPTDEGYGKMADAWFAGIQEAIQKGWIKDPVPLSKAPTGSGCSAVPVWNPINEIAVGEGSANLWFSDLDGKKLSVLGYKYLIFVTY
jgi:lysophospholipase L1-like esterase